MIFLSKEPHLSVISKITKKRIALFVDHKFETENPDIIERLKPHFKYESPKVVSNLAKFVKLKKEASEKGINTFRMKKKDIEKVLENLKEGE